MNKNKTFMVQGTTSDAGKSVLVAGLCRVLKRQGINVCPFKPQNMALNSAVTADGGEIGRAQAVQAFAAGIEPLVDMNPVLLKPNTDTGAQVIIHGKAVTDMEAMQYHDYKTVAMNAVLESHQRLTQQFDLIMVEGAGSPAEINLRDRDIANMGFAEAVDCPVIIVADIDRGGVFAHLVGTLALLSESEQNRVVGFVINRFRGDYALLKPGVDWLEERTGKKVLGTLPYLHGLHIEAEDAINIEQILNDKHEGKLKIAVPVFSRISNHTDFDVLRLHPQVDLQLVAPGSPIPACDLIVLPGSKSVRSDLDFLRAQGWEEQINQHLRYGGRLLGICGGFQMLGEIVSDPNGIEGHAGETKGLGFLNFSTEIKDNKQLQQVTGTLSLNNKTVPLKGYEIHAGVSQGEALKNSLTKLLATIENPNDGKLESKEIIDGVVADDNKIIGSYVHGLFDQPEALQLILEWAGLQQVEYVDYEKIRNQQIDRLADAIEQNMDLSWLQ